MDYIGGLVCSGESERSRGHMPPQPDQPRTIETRARYSRRLLLVYRAASILTISLAAAWLVFFALHGLWLLVTMEAVFVLLSAAGLAMILKGWTSKGILVSQASFLTFLIVFCLIFDTPSEAVPRVIHDFLLVLALVGYINYKAAPSKIQLALIAGSLLAYLAFAINQSAPSFAMPIPDEIRAPTYWINIVISTAMMCGAVILMQREITVDNELVRDLRIAIRDNQLELFLQPQVDEMGRIVGAEGLLRWKRPFHGYIPPADFLPTAEAVGLMPEIGHLVLTQACGILGRWKSMPDKRSLTLSINISPDHFLMPELQHQVLAALRKRGVEPSRLKLELTESVLVAGVEAVAAQMAALKDAGIVIALDDFGTGFSSLSYLQSLPIDQLKIDHSFVRNAVRSKRGASLAASIIQMGQDLNLQVVAEGVETPEQWEFFRSRRCTLFQGYLFGKAMAVPEFETVLVAQIAEKADNPA